MDTDIHITCTNSLTLFLCCHFSFSFSFLPFFAFPRISAAFLGTTGLKRAETASYLLLFSFVIFGAVSGGRGPGGKGKKGGKEANKQTEIDKSIGAPGRYDMILREIAFFSLLRMGAVQRLGVGFGRVPFLLLVVCVCACLGFCAGTAYSALLS